MKQVTGVILALAFTRGGMAQTTFHGNIARTGVYDSAGPTTSATVEWTFKTEGPVIGSPAVAGGVVYIGSSDGHLYAIDQATGQQKWKDDTGEPVVSSPRRWPTVWSTS